MNKPNFTAHVHRGKFYAQLMSHQSNTRVDMREYFMKLVGMHETLEILGFHEEAIDFKNIITAEMKSLNISTEAYKL